MKKLRITFYLYLKEDISNYQNIIFIQIKKFLLHQIIWIILKLGNRKPLNIILNAKLKGKLFRDISFDFKCYDNLTRYIGIDFGNKNLKREYDWTSTFTIDISEKGCTELIEVNKNFGKNENIIFNNLTVEFNDSFLSFDYKSYKKALEKSVN